MAIRFPAAAMLVGYVSRWGALLAVIIVLVVTAPSPPSLPSFDNTDTNNQARQVDGRLDLTAQVSSVASFRKNRFRRTNEICYYSQAKYCI